MSKTDPMRGVFPILITPFDQAGRIDEDSLRSLVEFNLAAGVHGLGVALGSEVFKLSEGERQQVTRILVDQVRGRVPVVINTSAPGTDLSVIYSQAAERNGADALMVMPPTAVPAGPAEILTYYRSISDAVGLPIFIQDTSSAPVSPSLARRIAEECEHVRYIKVESLPVTVKVAEMVAGADDCLTVFGGAGGSYFIEELRRGSQGTMPFCSQPEAFVGVWNLVQAGDERAARELFDRTIMPVNRIADQGLGIYYYVHKEILRQRGVIHSATVRSPAAPPDELTRCELQQLIETLYRGGKSDEGRVP
ncbi:MAG: dihydrodipicolinate synthase family protein [Anaerolineales bacterium]|nr:dihydrodipicolinate synthase family protein [Anaerolineales bacterium]